MDCIAGLLVVRCPRAAGTVRCRAAVRRCAGAAARAASWQPCLGAPVLAVALRRRLLLRRLGAPCGGRGLRRRGACACPTTCAQQLAGVPRPRSRPGRRRRAARAGRPSGRTRASRCSSAPSCSARRRAPGSTPGSRSASLAPAKYSGNCGPGTLEMATLIIGGSRSASFERPASEARPDSIHGAPQRREVGGQRAHRCPSASCACCDDAWMAISRSTRSSMSVHRLTSIVDTWLLASVLPGCAQRHRHGGDQRLVGLAVVVGQVALQRAGADRQTTSLTLVPLRLPMALISASGTERAAKERWLEIDTFSGVLGARCRRARLAEAALAVVVGHRRQHVEQALRGLRQRLAAG